MDATQEQQVQFQQQMSLKAQEANIAITQQQQTYCYREAMAKEIAQPVSAMLAMSILAVTAFALISRSIRSGERVKLDRHQADIAIAKYEASDDGDDDVVTTQ